MSSTTTTASRVLGRALRRQRLLGAWRTSGDAERSCIAISMCTARTLSSTRASSLSSRTTTHTSRFLPTHQHTTRAYSTNTQDAASAQPPSHLNPKESEIWTLLHAALAPTKLEVSDISGGCGSMYGIEVLSERFRGLSMLRQQRLVNEVLKEEIGGWHGVQLKTGVP